MWPPVPSPQVTHSVGLEWILRICSKKFPGDAYSADLGTTLWETPSQRYPSWPGTKFIMWLKLPLFFLLCHLLLLPAGSQSVWFSSNISQLPSPHPPRLSSCPPMPEHTRGLPSCLTWHCWESLLPCPAVGSLPVSKPSRTVCGCPPAPVSPICHFPPCTAIDSAPQKEGSSGSAVVHP